MTKRNTKQRLGLKEFILTLALMLIIWGAREFLGLDLLSDSSVIVSEPSGAIQVFFTAPRYPEDANNRFGGLDEQLADAIDQAEHTVDVAAYDFDLARVAQALVQADQRNVRVRLLTDSDYEEELGPVTVERAGIPVVYDNRGPFMHNKFVIIDSEQVWTGSWNLTDNGTYRNNNNAVVIHSEKLAQNYTDEFEEMFLDGQYGASSPDTIAYPAIDLNGVLIETTFEAEGNVRDRIIELIQEAEESILFMAFVFTDDDIAQALIDQHRAGLSVAGVVEGRNISASGSDIEAMQQAGIYILGDGNPYIMHHKVIIIDEAIVVTGSYNFSASAANSNDENVLIISSPEIASLYVDEFERVYQRAEEAEP